MNISAAQSASSPWKALYAAAGLAIILTITFMAVDWINYFFGTTSLYPAYAKPLVSILCAAVALSSLRNPLSRRDALLLSSAFGCIVVVDICMSIYVYGSSSSAASIAFIIGALLSIAAHLILIIRHARGFRFLRQPSKPGFAYRFGFPLAFYLPVVVIFLLLIPFLVRVNQFWPSLLYAIILTTSLWIGWETVRQRLFPPPNALLIAWGTTFWFLCELVGVVHNIEVGALSDIAMNLTWLFYMPGILLLAFSGHRLETPGTYS